MINLALSKEKWWNVGQKDTEYLSAKCQSEAKLLIKVLIATSQKHRAAFVSLLFHYKWQISETQKVGY